MRAIGYKIQKLGHTFHFVDSKEALLTQGLALSYKLKIIDDEKALVKYHAKQANQVLLFDYFFQVS